MIDLISQVPGRRGMSRAERRQLTIETTLASLALHGAEGTSLRSVCRDMKVSPALLTHSFTGWHDLLVAAYETATERFIGQLAPILTRAFSSERARMLAMIRDYMAIEWVGNNTTGTMIAFWQLSRSVPELKEPFSRFLEQRQRIMWQGVAKLAEEMGSPIDPDEITTSLIFMMDGIWLHMSLNPGNISAARAEEICWIWVAERLGVALRTQPRVL